MIADNVPPSGGVAVPDWLRRVAEEVPTDSTGTNPILARYAAADADAREAAVLVLFGGTADADPNARGGLPADAEVLLTQRASTLRQHRGQVAFPGGGADPGDDGPIATALREAEEETGLDPAGVQPLATWPGIYVPPSRFDVTPVIAYWRTPSAVDVVDRDEAERVVRVPVSTLLDPANRFIVRHPLGYFGPAFTVDGMVVWGFTGGILAGVFAVSGWEVEWDRSDVRDLESTLAAAGMGDSLVLPPELDSPSLRKVDR
ncbi:NUDIX hydrolase [Antrihabitans stalagmiti]|uniref:NUDIX hydrolase n=1 Tax=Antrihabitans stalagmiti TaxID=2799499 RepID=UPI003556E9B7